MKVRLGTVLLACTAAIAMAGAAFSQTPGCPVSTSVVPAQFPDNVLGMQTGMNVNPDGADQSYLPGDHGFTYIADGVNRWVGGHQPSCVNDPKCRSDWLADEAGKFGPGTTEFCVFAMEVAPYQGNPLEKCGGARHVVGNAKGVPQIGNKVDAVTGGQVDAYRSTTALAQTVAGNETYVDSAKIPGLVVPNNDTYASLLGAVAWVKYGNRETYAIVSDTGPAFGEGSVALLQILYSGSVQAQPVGPVPAGQRCGASEPKVKPPFVLSPTTGDECHPGAKPKYEADIRAKGAIGGGVTSFILSNVRPPMKGGTLVKTEITPQLLKNLAVQAGYTSQKLNQMADCFSR